MSGSIGEEKSLINKKFEEMTIDDKKASIALDDMDYQLLHIKKSEHEKSLDKLIQRQEILDLEIQLKMKKIARRNEYELKKLKNEN